MAIGGGGGPPSHPPTHGDPGGGGRGRAGRPEPTQTSAKNTSLSDYDQCVKDGSRACYLKGRNHFDENFWWYLGAGAVGLPGGAQTIYGAIRKLGVRSVMLRFVVTKITSIYGITVSAALGLRQLAMEGVKKEEECMETLREECKKQCGM